MKTLTVLCPVYNEEEVIAAFYEELRSVLNSIDDYESRVIFVVDRCTDSTLLILKRIAATDSAVQILVLSSRFGHQMSLLAGLDHCDSDVVIMMDCDLQHPPSLIPVMLAEHKNGYEIVYTIREDLPETGIWKRLTSRGFYRLMNSISKVPISENAADFRLISRRVTELFQSKIRERNQFLRGLFQWVGFKSKAIHFVAGSRQAGKSKYSLGRMVQFGVHGIISFSKKPLQATIVVGFVFASFGLLYAVVTFVQFFFYASLPSGWTTLTILISMFSGVQLIFLGIIAQYIGAIFDEVKNRPHYIVEEKVNFPYE
jgi:polyisoprenyl-phosphate glycosyltransferase